MKVAIDISPIKNKYHKVRGVGSYLSSLITALEKENVSLIKIDGIDNIPNEADIVHIPFFDPFQKYLPLFKKKKTVVTVHDLTPLVLSEQFPIGMRGKVYWNLNKYILQNCDAIITDSQSSATDVENIAGVKNSKISSVYLSADERFKHRKLSIKQTADFRNKLKLPDRFVLYVGDATPNKNLPRLIDAVKQINLTLVMVGKTLANKDYDSQHPWNKDLHTVHTRIKNDERFITPGYVYDDDLVNIYHCADLLVMPSLYEGFGLPVLEAMKSGCPVVTTKEGSLPEVAGNAAYYVDARDTTSIANGISEVFFIEELRNNLISKGLKQADKFSWKNTAKETVKVYEKILGEE